jgi:hypothetical protein
MRMCGGVAAQLHIHDLGTSSRWVVSFTLWFFYSWGNSHWYALDRRLGGPQSQSGYVEKGKISWSSQELYHGSPACSPSLYQVSYPGSLACTFLRTWEVGNWSMKMVLVPRVNTAYSWISLKMFSVIYNKIHYWKHVLTWGRVKISNW